jgi:hypothetical protein
MRRFLSLFFIFIYINSATELHELVKLPLLLTHYMHHKEGNKNLSFENFITLHYSDKKLHDNEQDNHQQLPFKSHPEMAFASTFVALLPTFETLEIKHPNSQSEKQIITSQNAFYSSAYLSNIWQPPKAC